MGSLGIGFHRDRNEIRRDVSETASNFCLGLMRIGFGKIYEVKNIPEGYSFTEKQYSGFVKTAAKVGAVILFPLILVGIAFSIASRSRSLLLHKLKMPSLKIQEPSTNGDNSQSTISLANAVDREEPGVRNSKEENEVEFQRKDPLSYMDLDNFKENRRKEPRKNGGTLGGLDLAVEPKDYSLRIASLSAADQIESLVESAHVFNEQIKTLTNDRYDLFGKPLTIGRYTFFTFDLEKWQGKINELRAENVLCDASLPDECRMDLIEALAEYNIDESLFKEDFSLMNDSEIEAFLIRNFGDVREDDKDSVADGLKECRLLSKIKSTGLSDSQKKLLQKAKSTLTGDLRLFSVENFDLGKSSCNLLLKGKKRAPYVNVLLNNSESNSWGNDYYYRHKTKRMNNGELTSLFLPLESLIGIRNNGRLIIAKSAEGEEQLILRCIKDRFSYGEKKTFEEQLIFYFLRTKANCPDADFWLSQFKAAYGKNCVNQLMNV